MRTKQLMTALFALTLIAGACASRPDSTDSPGASSSNGSTAAPGATESIAATATSGSSTGAGSTPSEAPTASGGDCTPEPPTALSANWTTLTAHDADYQMKFIGTWDKLYGAFVFDTTSLIDPQTFAETGLPDNSQTRADLVRSPGNGLPNASVLVVPGVVSDLATIFARQVERFRAIADIKILSTDLTACLGGQEAKGVSFTFSNDTTYQESWFMVRAGRSYDFQWLAPKGQEQVDVFHEMFRTWQWTPDVPVATPLPSTSDRPSAAPSATGQASAFVLAGMALKVDSALGAAEPRDFVAVVPTESTAIYAVFALMPGLSGQVDGALLQGDKVLVTLSLQYGATNTWGDFRINSESGIAAGDYTMLIKYVPTGDTVRIPFSAK